MVQRIQLENWKLTGMKEVTEISLAWLLQGLPRSHRSAESGDGSKFIYARIAGLKPKLKSSNKSPEYIYIYINIMRLLPSKCEPVLETCDTDILRHDYSVLNLFFYTKQHMCNIVKVQIF